MISLSVKERKNCECCLTGIYGRFLPRPIDRWFFGITLILVFLQEDSMEEKKRFV